MSAAVAISAVQDLLGRMTERWKDTDKPSTRLLLRVAILRELSQALHSEKSRCLATGRKPEAQSIRELEGRIQRLRDCSPLENELGELLAGPTTEAAKRTRLLPEALFRAIPRDKFERYDRSWESALAAEACKAGWNFWSLTAWTEISRIEEWDELLRGRIWPHGLILFAESAVPEPGKSPAPVSETLWHGRWTLVLHPQFESPNDLNLDLSRFPGAPELPSSPPAWRLLFSPRRR